MEITHFGKKGSRWLKLEFLTYQRVGLLRGREVGNLLMHASIPSTHISSLSLGFLYFSLFFFVYSVFFTFFLSFCFLFSVVPFFTNHNYSILYYLPWQNLPFLPFNHFWLILGVLLRLTTGLPSGHPPPPPLHSVGCTTPHFQKKIVLFCLLPPLTLSPG